MVRRPRRRVSLFRDSSPIAFLQSVPLARTLVVREVGEPERGVGMDVKARLRKGIVDEQRRRNATRPVASRRVFRHLHTLLEESRVTVVAGYMAFDGEVDLTGFLCHALALGKRVWLPRYDRAAGSYTAVAVGSLSGDVAVGHYGIREPRPELPSLAAEDLCKATVLWLVPGMAFDARGHRLGRGKGYYDRLLEDTRGMRAGVCWDWQVLADIPACEHDICMHVVVTEKRRISCDCVKESGTDCTDNSTGTTTEKEGGAYAAAQD